MFRFTISDQTNQPFSVSLKISASRMLISLTGLLLETEVREMPSRTASPSINWPNTEWLKVEMLLHTLCNKELRVVGVVR